MDACESLYDQPAMYFTLRLFLKEDTFVPGRLIVELATTFLDDLVLPPCRPKWLWTKRAKDDAKLNTGDFSERRWNAVVKKIVSGEISALTRTAWIPGVRASLVVMASNSRSNGRAASAVPSLNIALARRSPRC